MKAKATSSKPAGRANPKATKDKTTLKSKASSTDLEESLSSEEISDSLALSSAGESSAPEEPSKPRKWKPGTTALREIRKYQKTTTLLIRKIPFARCVRAAVAQKKTAVRIQEGVFDALQQCLEKYIVDIISRANLCAIHGRRITLSPKDLKLVLNVQEH